MRYRAHVAGTALAVAAAAALTAACGTGSSPAAGSAAPADYLTCLRQHGVNVPQVDRSGGGPSSEGFVFPSEKLTTPLSLVHAAHAGGCRFGMGYPLCH